LMSPTISDAILKHDFEIPDWNLKAGRIGF